jgi:hypothetical protein
MYKFEALPAAYNRENPLLTLDVDRSTQEVKQLEPEYGDDKESHTNSGSEENEIQRMQQTLREMLKESINLTYNTFDKDALYKASDQVAAINRSLKESQQREDGLELMHCRKTQKKEPCPSFSQDMTFGELPLIKRQKCASKFHGRVGQAAESWRRATQGPHI